MKKALVVIDMQNDFIDGALGTPEAVLVVPRVLVRVRAAAAEAATHGTKLIFTQDTHAPDYLLTAEGKRLPVEHCVKPSKGWEISSVLLPYTKQAVVLEKPTFGAVGLPAYVTDCDEITLVGLCTDICVISNAMLLKAFLPEATVRVEAACCAGVTPESHRNALNAMKMCHIEIV